MSFGARDSAQDNHLRCCIHLAVENGREETLSMLLEETGSSLVNVPDHKQRTSLHYASFVDNPKVRLYLIISSLDSSLRFIYLIFKCLFNLVSMSIFSSKLDH